MMKTRFCPMSIENPTKCGRTGVNDANFGRLAANGGTDAKLGRLSMVTLNFEWGRVTWDRSPDRWKIRYKTVAITTPTVTLTHINLKGVTWFVDHVNHNIIFGTVFLGPGFFTEGPMMYGGFPLGAGPHLPPTHINLNLKYNLPSTHVK